MCTRLVRRIPHTRVLKLAFDWLFFSYRKGWVFIHSPVCEISYWVWAAGLVALYKTGEQSQSKPFIIFSYIFFLFQWLVCITCQSLCKRVTCMAAEIVWDVWIRINYLSVVFSELLRYTLCQKIHTNCYRHRLEWVQFWISRPDELLIHVNIHGEAPGLRSNEMACQNCHLQFSLCLHIIVFSWMTERCLHFEGKSACERPLETS